MKIRQINDELLLSAIEQGDKKAYNALFRKYYPILCAYTNRFVCMADSEEIVQDLLLWLWENRKSHTINTLLSQYLFKAVYHRALNKIVQNESTHRADTLFYKQMQEMLEDTDFYQIEELKKLIEEAVNTLPPSYREAFVMHRFENMSYKEIATALNISSKTVDYRIQQALKQLRVDLKEYLPTILSFLLA